MQSWYVTIFFTSIKLSPWYRRLCDKFCMTPVNSWVTQASIPTGFKHSLGYWHILSLIVTKKSSKRLFSLRADCLLSSTHGLCSASKPGKDKQERQNIRMIIQCYQIQKNKCRILRGLIKLECHGQELKLNLHKKQCFCVWNQYIQTENFYPWNITIKEKLTCSNRRVFLQKARNSIASEKWMFLNIAERWRQIFSLQVEGRGTNMAISFQF